MKEKKEITVRFTGEHISNNHKFQAKLEAVEDNGNLQYRLEVDKFIKHILENAEAYKIEYSIQ